MKSANQNYKTIIFLVVLITVGFLVRFYQLGKVPNGLTVDETDVGYNAYSLIKTGKDVYGRSHPLVFQSFDDYKPALAIYLSMPAIYFFGLSEFSVRLIAAVLGSLAPLLIFWFIMLLYPKNRLLAAVAALLALFAPWNIAISRAEPALMEFLFIYLVFFILFFLGLKKNPKFLLLSAIAIAINLYVYYASVIYIPITIFLLAAIYRNKLRKNLKITLFSALILFFLALPAIFLYSTSRAKNRFNNISIFTPDITLSTSISEMKNDIDSGNKLAAIIHNRRYAFFLTALGNYFDYFNLDYLFISSDQTRYFYVNYVGLYYLVEVPFVLYGLFILVKRRKQNDIFILSLLIVSPIPAIITLGSPFPHRGLLLLLFIQIVSALGFTTAASSVSGLKKPFTSAFVVIYASSVLFFFHQYFIHSPKEFNSETNNGAWFSTVKDAIPIVNANKDKYDRVVFTWSKAKLVPAVYFLFYNQIDPRLLQVKVKNWTNEPPSYRQVYNQIGNIEFRPINWEIDQFLKNTLFVGYPNEFPSGISGIIARTYTPNGQLHFLIVKTD